MDTLRVAGVPEHFNLPWQLALERDAFRKAGMDVRWSTVPEGTGAMCAMLRTGATDLAVLVTEGAVRDILQGNPGRIVGTFVASPLTWGVHVGTASGLRTPADLGHVPFAISRFNSGSHLMAMCYAEQLGWRPAEADFVVVNDLAGAVDRLGGSEPLVFLWEAAMTSAWVDRGLLRKVDEYRPPWPCFVVVARNDVLEHSRGAIRRMLAVLHHQAQELMARKDLAALVSQRFGIGPKAAGEWARSVEWTTTGHVDPASLLGVCAILHRVGMLDRTYEEGELLRSLVERI